MDDWTDLVKSSMLTRPVTLDNYFAETMLLVRKGKISKSVVDKDKENLEARFETGDEWWEWVTGNEPLMQMGGLALVRQGRIHWARIS